MAITHQMVLDENGDPTAALIPWAEFEEIQKRLGNDDEEKLRPELRAELDRRREGLLNGNSAGIPHEEVISHVRERISKLGESKQSA